MYLAWLFYTIKFRELFDEQKYTPGVVWMNAVNVVLREELCNVRVARGATNYHYNLLKFKGMVDAVALSK